MRLPSWGGVVEEREDLLGDLRRTARVLLAAAATCAFAMGGVEMARADVPTICVSAGGVLVTADEDGVNVKSTSGFTYCRDADDGLD
jgi:hypothetical protein